MTAGGKLIGKGEVRLFGELFARDATITAGKSGAKTAARYGTVLRGIGR